MLVTSPSPHTHTHTLCVLKRSTVCRLLVLDFPASPTSCWGQDSLLVAGMPVLLSWKVNGLFATGRQFLGGKSLGNSRPPRAASPLFHFPPHPAHLVSLQPRDVGWSGDCVWSAWPPWVLSPPSRPPPCSVKVRQMFKQTEGKTSVHLNPRLIYVLIN